MCVCVECEERDEEAGWNDAFGVEVVEREEVGGRMSMCGLWNGAGGVLGDVSCGADWEVDDDAMGGAGGVGDIE